MNFRAKNFLISVVFPLLSLLFLKVAGFEGFVFYGTVVICFLLEYFLIFWLFNFNVLPQGFLTILLLPSIWFASFLLISQNFIFDLKIIYQILAFALFTTLQYYFISTQNILNLSYFKSISLSQAAFTTNNFYTTLTFFTVSLAIFLMPGQLILVKLLLSLLSFSVILFVFTLLHHVDRTQYFYSVFMYFSLILLLSLINFANIIPVDKLILSVVILSLIFRGVIIFLLFSARKVLAVSDYVQILLEVSITAAIFLYFIK